MKTLATPRFYTLWAINGALDHTRLRRQLDRFREAGFDGVVFHPRFYPNDPPYLGDRYLREVSDAILYAKSIGLAFWIYDEDGWPSGTVGGQLLQQFPTDAQRWAELVTERPERCLLEFEHEGEKLFVTERMGAGVDYFNPDLARHFLELTHERYRTGLAPEAWKHVEAIFCDEPEFGLGHAYDSLSKYGAIPWTPNLPDIFQRRHGQDLLPLLPRLFLSGENCGDTRVKFWELLTDLFNESFTAPINDWCGRHGKRFTAHVKGEEHPLFQVPTSGSCHQFFRNLSLPGIDALERFPANDFFPRQASSAAQQFGDGRCMAEAFGGAGWGAAPEDLERYLLWLGRHGLTDFVLHLSQYQLTSAVVRDWPPSQPLHVNWAAAYPEILRRVREELRQNPPAAADTLLVAPYRGIMAAYEPWELLQTNVHNAATYPDSPAGKLNRCFLEQIQGLHAAGVRYHIADERTFEEFGVPDVHGVRVGNCVYGKILFAEGAKVNEEGRRLPELTGLPPAFGLKPRPGAATVIQPAAGEELVAVKWTLGLEPVNALLLEPAPTEDGWFACDFTCDQGLPAIKDVEVAFADAVAEMMVNGHPVRVLPKEFGYSGSLAEAPIAALNNLRFRFVQAVQRPLVWLHGRFRLASATPFETGPNGTVFTSGPWTLRLPREGLDYDLLQAGFPFLRPSLVVETIFQSAGPVHSLQFSGIRADAARIGLLRSQWDSLIFM